MIVCADCGRDLKDRQIELWMLKRQVAGVSGPLPWEHICNRCLAISDVKKLIAQYNITSEEL